MTIHLVTNPAVPAAGIYACRAVSDSEFGDLVRSASRRRQLRSWVGYEQSLDICELLSGVSIPLVRERLTSLADGDTQLLIQLRPRPRGEKTTRDVILRPVDFDYFEVTFRK